MQFVAILKSIRQRVFFKPLDMEKDKTIKSQKAFIFWLFLFIASIILIVIYIIFTYLVYEGNTEMTFTQLTLNLLIKIFTTLFSIIILGFLYQWFVEKETAIITQQRIIQAIQSNENVLNLFTFEERENFIKNNIISIIGKNHGEELFNSLLKRYLDKKLTYRNNYSYDVSLLEEQNNFPSLNKTNNKNDLVLTQRLTSAKHFSKKRKDIGFKIVLPFDEKSLDYWLDDEMVFMREILRVENIDSIIRGLNKNNLREFVLKELLLKIEFLDKNDNVIMTGNDIEVIYHNDISKRGLEIILNEKEFRKQCIFFENDIVYYKAKASFKVPFSEASGRFHFIITEPTIKPRFSIIFDKKITNIDYMTYFSQKEDGFKWDTNNDYLNYKIYADSIIYPRSGIIFFW